MTDQSDTRNVDDVAPGLLGAADRNVWQDVQVYVIGLALAILLTVASFAVVYTHLIWEPAIPAALVVLAIAQMGVHLVFFLHLTTAPDNTNNVLALAFGVLIVFLVMIGTIWIMAHMNMNVGTPPELMNLQMQH